MVTKNMGFLQGLKQGIWEIKGLGFRKYPQDFLEFLLRSKRWGFFQLLFIFHSKGYLVVLFFPKRLFGWFFFPKGLFSKFFGLWECYPVLAL